MVYRQAEKKKKGKAGIIIVIVLVVAASAIGAGILITRNNGGSNNGADNNIDFGSNPYNSSVNYKLFEPPGLNRSVDQLVMNPTYNTLTGDYRPRWIGCSDDEYLQIFGSLPKFPQDFYKKYSMFMQGTLTDYDRLGPEYWSQPEWYGLDQTFFYNYINRPTGMWTPGAVGCKPGIRQLEMKQGATVSISTFFHDNIDGSEAYLGGILYAELPSAAEDMNGKPVINQSADAANYIHIRLTTPDNDSIYESGSFQKNISGLYENVGPQDRLVIFYPTYSKVDEKGTKVLTGFRPGWCYKVTLSITVDKNCPLGNYVAAIDMKNPSAAIVQEFNWVISSAPYYGFYFNAIREWRPSCPYFQAIITVQ